MEISILTAAVLESSSLKDSTTLYDHTVKQNFTLGEDLQDNDEVFQWVKPSYIPIDYAHGDEHTYKTNDIIFKDGKVQVVKTVGEKYIPQQPDAYTTGFDNTFTFGTWTKYYSKIQTGLNPAAFNGYKKVVSGITHELYRDQGSSTGWYYRLSWDVAQNYWGTEQFDIVGSDGKTSRIRSTNKPATTLTFNGMALLVNNATAKPTPYVTEYTVGADKYRAGKLNRTQATVKAGVKEYSTSGSFVVPEGVTSIHVCMIGGGGAGGSCEDIHAHTQAGGGKAGVINSFDLAVTAGERIPYSTGAGGLGVLHSAGKVGAATVFGSKTAAGGAGGSVTSTAYAGNGGSKTNCYGTFKDGLSRSSGGSSMYGGEAGFANGGAAFTAGSKGSGGGGSQAPYAKGATGGRGWIKISWAAEGGTTAYYYGVQKQYSKNIVDSVVKEANFYTTLDENSLIENSYCFKTTDCNNSWIGKTFVLRGGDLYVRTAVGVAELEHVLKPEYAIAYNLEDLKASGFIYLRPIIPLVPLDEKNYTHIETSGTFTFTIKSEGMFNTLALSGMIADTVDLIFKDAAGTQVAVVNNYEPANNRDVDHRLPDYITTAVLYSYDPNTDKVIDIPKGGTVTITLKGDYIELGTAFLGLSVNAGFTNLVFQNEFLDLSPMEKDQWHNIIRKEGVKINIHSGTVDIPITQYDMMNRLMISIGGGTVILNGSGSTDNTPPSSSCVFASTMMVGRMENIRLMTRMDDKEIGDMANYSFRMVENV